MQYLNQEYLKLILNYDNETGIFTWKESVNRKIKIGSVAGCKHSKGYLRIKIKGKFYSSHRLAWFYVYGIFTKNDIDHINGIKTDNRICNLREATKSENLQNQKLAQKNNKTGFLGVRLHKLSGKFTSQIRINRKAFHLGYFKTAQEAHEAYIKAKRELHEFNTL